MLFVLSFAFKPIIAASNEIANSSGKLLLRRILQLQGNLHGFYKKKNGKINTNSYFN